MAVQALSDAISSGDEISENAVTEPERVPVSSELLDHVAIDVPASIDFPSNNSGTQLVDHMAIDITVSIDVPSKNSGPQLVSHVAAEVSNNNSSRGQQDGNNDGELKTAAFFAVADCATSITAIACNPPRSGHPAYLVAVVTISTVSVLAVLAALWVLGDARKRRTAKRMILCSSIATFILGLMLDVYAYKVKK